MLLYTVKCDLCGMQYTTTRGVTIDKAHALRSELMKYYGWIHRTGGIDLCEACVTIKKAEKIRAKKKSP